MRHPADTTNRIYDDEDLIAFAQCIQGRKGNADLRP